MRFNRSVMPAIATLALAGGLLTGILAPSQGIGTPTPSPSVTIADCSTIEDRICAPLTDADRARGWDAWEFGQGTRSLKVDPSRPYRVDYVGVSALPSLAEGESAVIGRDFQWHVFAVRYTD